LNDQQREVIVLRFVEDYSIAETAQIMQKRKVRSRPCNITLESLRRYLQR
jgi:DNA-directed RNA polymerase specialized sigma24 family protein